MKITEDYVVKLTKQIFEELAGKFEQSSNLLRQAKTVITNEIGSCRSTGCTEDKPCKVCRTRYKVVGGIDEYFQKE